MQPGGQRLRAAESCGLQFPESHRCGGAAVPGSPDPGKLRLSRVFHGEVLPIELASGKAARRCCRPADVCREFPRDPCSARVAAETRLEKPSKSPDRWELASGLPRTGCCRT